MNDPTNTGGVKKDWNAPVVTVYGDIELLTRQMVIKPKIQVPGDDFSNATSTVP